MKKYNPVPRVFLVIIAFVSVGVTFSFYIFQRSVEEWYDDGNGTDYLTQLTHGRVSHIYVRRTEDLDLKYPASSPPADWVFNIIWPVIYTWSFIGVFYMLTTLCCCRGQSPVLRETPLMPNCSLVFYILTWLFYLAWTFLYDREYMGAALAMLILSAWSGYLCLALSYQSYHRNVINLENNNRVMLWLVRIVIHNGFAVLTTWLTCAWKLTFALVVTYVDSKGIETVPAELLGQLTSEDAGTVALSLLIMEMVVWFVLENFIFEEQCRYTVTIYPVLIFVFCGIFLENYTIIGGQVQFSRNQIITLTGLVVASCAFFARIVHVTVRHISRPRDL